MSQDAKYPRITVDPSLPPPHTQLHGLGASIGSTLVSGLSSHAMHRARCVVSSRAPLQEFVFNLDELLDLPALATQNYRLHLAVIGTEPDLAINGEMSAHTHWMPPARGTRYCQAPVGPWPSQCTGRNP